MSTVVTGEAVALELRTAALPSRVVAALVDGLLQLLLALVLGAAVVFLDPASGAAQAAYGVLITVLVLVGYPCAFETVLRGRTPGKAAVGLRVVRDDGGPVGFRQAFVRALVGAALERPGVTLFFAAVVTSLVNGQGKRVGDLLAGTVVLQERVPGGPTAGSAVPPPLAGWAASLDLSGLSPDLLASVREFTARAPELAPAARDDLGGRLVREVVARLGTPPPDGTPGWAVLAAVLGERRRRAEQGLAPGALLDGPGAGRPSPASGPLPPVGQRDDPGAGPADDDTADGTAAGTPATTSPTAPAPRPGGFAPPA